MPLVALTKSISRPEYGRIASNRRRVWCDGMTLTTIAASCSASSRLLVQTTRFRNRLLRQEQIVHAMCGDAFADFGLVRPQAHAGVPACAPARWRLPFPKLPRR